MQCGLGERKNIIPFSEGTNQWLKGLSYIKYNSVFSLIIQEEKKMYVYQISKTRRFPNLMSELDS